MITTQQIQKALELLNQYIDQQALYEKELSIEKSIVNLQTNITPSTFSALKQYFKEVENEELEWNNLKAIPLEKLTNLDYLKLRRYRGFGFKSELKLKDLIDNSIMVNSLF